MIEKIIDFSLKNKLIIILFTISLAAFGVYSMLNLSVGAVPDITNNQVQVITTTGNLSTQEVEQYITAPVELEMANLPGVEEIRSVSKFGLSVVTIVFEERLGTYLPRQLIAEKIKSASANIPEEFGTPEMGPITTGLGEVYQYILDVKPGYEDQYSSMELRTIQDWIVRRLLSGINGVVEINSWGGHLKQYVVAVDPKLLKSFDLSLTEVFDAIESNNSISGGSYIEKAGETYFIRGDGQIEKIEDIENIVIENRNGVPILVKNIANVEFGYATRYGAITANGEGEKVLGQIMMLKGANSRKVMADIHTRVAEVQKSLPEGVFINPILDRSELIEKTTSTVIENLVFGCIIVFLVVWLILGNIRSALVIASMIPLALLFTLSLMFLTGIDANLMSLGALDFGIIIDGAVIIVEYIAYKLTKQKAKLLANGNKEEIIDGITYEGASKMMKSAIFGQIIILIVFIPILTLSGVEGKMFKPMALTFSFAIIGAMILGFTWLPVVSSIFLKPDKDKKSKWNLSEIFMNLVHKSYLPVIKWSCCHKKAVLGMAIASLIITGIVFSRMGGEFVPTLDEGDFVIQPVLKTGTSLSQTIELTTQMEQILINKFPEVEQIVSRIGAAEVPTDPMSMEEIDMIIRLKPPKEWTSASSKEELADLFKEELSIIPGIEYEFTQPIEMRFNELITGVRSDIAIKIYGDDLDYLNLKANEIKNLISNVEGAADIILEKTVGLPQMTVKYDRKKLALYGADVKTLNDHLATAFGGATTGSVFEGAKRFDLVVKFDENNRKDIDDIRELPVKLESGLIVPLKELANIDYDEGPAKISRENTHRRVVVSVNVRNRDLKSVVTDIQKIVEDNIVMEPGTYIEYGGQFENLENASNRLLLAVPVALLLIFVFLHFAFKSLRDAILIFTAVPLATVGGVLLLWLRDMPFSISAGIGFIALFGIAVLNGIVLIEHLKELQSKGTFKSMRELIIQGSRDRLRPVLLTAAAAAMGFFPMAISTGAGAEVQRPLATVVIGGLITSTMLTMIALPLLFEIFHNVKGIKFRPFKVIRSNTLILIIAFSGLAHTVNAQQSTLNLEQVKEIAFTNNKQLKTMQLQIEESEAMQNTAFSFDKTSFYYDYDQNNIAENNYPLKIFGVEQSFKFPTQYSSKLKSNKLKTEIRKLEYQKHKQILEKELTQMYYEIIYLTNARNVYQMIDSLYFEIEEKAIKSQNAGEINHLDYLNTLAKKQKTETDLSTAENNLKIAYEKLYALMNSQDNFTIVYEEISKLKVETGNLENNIEYQIFKNQTDYFESIINANRQQYTPDFNLGYFYGSNNYPNSKTYNGFTIGIDIPLFWSEQKANTNVAKISYQINQNQFEDNLFMLNSKQKQLLIELENYKELIRKYEESGSNLSDQIILSAQKSFEAGEIDYFKFVNSMDNALNSLLYHYENIAKHNKTIIELKFLTI
jgi:cobalt-zinc-cadmium resistance protein CzcA